MSFAVERSTKTVAHWMFHDEGSGNHHFSRAVRKGTGHDGDGWYPCFFESSRNVSDRHVADRSDGHKEHVVDLFALDPVDPGGKFTAEAPLCRRSREGVEGGG